MMRRRFFPPALSAVLCLLLLLGGCDNTLDPIAEGGAFAIHGFLNVSEERQFIRVHDLKRPLTPEGTRELDATVTLENLETGTVTPLRDSVTTFDSVYTHNFWARVDVQPDTEYRVVAEAPDGSRSQSTTTTPPAVAPVAEPAEGDCVTSFSVIFPGVEERLLIRASVGFLPESALPDSLTDGSPIGPRPDPPPTPRGGRVWVADGESGAVQVGKRGGNPSIGVFFTPEEVLSAEIDSQDDPLTRFELEPRCLKLGDNEIHVAYTHLGPAWSGRFPGVSRFDPTTSDFVENGLGFFGGIRQDTVSVVVDTSGTIPIRP